MICRNVFGSISGRPVCDGGCMSDEVGGKRHGLGGTGGEQLLVSPEVLEGLSSRSGLLWIWSSMSGRVGSGGQLCLVWACGSAGWRMARHGGDIVRFEGGGRG